MSGKLPRVKYDELLRALKRAGYKEQHQRGSHIRLWRESDKRQITTVFHKGKDVPIGTALTRPPATCPASPPFSSGCPYPANSRGEAICPIQGIPAHERDD